MWQHEAFKEKWGSRLVQRSVHKCQNQRGIHVQKLPVKGSWLHVQSRGSNKWGISVKMLQDRDRPDHGPVQDLAQNQSLSWRIFWSQFSLLSTNMWHQVSLDLIQDPVFGEYIKRTLLLVVFSNVKEDMMSNPATINLNIWSIHTAVMRWVKN